MSIKASIAPTILVAGLALVPSAQAHARLIHCRQSAYDRHESAFAIVTDRAMGCRLADAWAGAWQAWAVDGAHNGTGAAIDDPGGDAHIVSFDYHNRYIGTFYTRYRHFRGHGDPLLRVQGHGTGRMFISFETAQ